MKQFVFLLVGLFGWALDACCQLPASTFKSAEASGTMVATLDKDNNRMNLIGTIRYHHSINKKWSYEAEVSTIERVYPHAISYVSRGNHVSAYSAVTRVFWGRVHVTASGFAIWDPKKINPVTKIWTVTGNFALRNGASVSASVENRNDEVNERFSFAGDAGNIMPDTYQFQTLIICYEGSADKRIATYAEGSAGLLWFFTLCISDGGAHQIFS